MPQHGINPSTKVGLVCVANATASSHSDLLARVSTGPHRSVYHEMRFVDCAGLARATAAAANAMRSVAAGGGNPQYVDILKFKFKV